MGLTRKILQVEQPILENFCGNGGVYLLGNTEFFARRSY